MITTDNRHLATLAQTELAQLGYYRGKIDGDWGPQSEAAFAAYVARIAAFESAYGSGSLESALAQLTAVKPVTYGYAQRTWGLSFP